MSSTYGFFMCTKYLDACHMRGLYKALFALVITLF